MQRCTDLRLPGRKKFPLAHGISGGICHASQLFVLTLRRFAGKKLEILS